MEALKKILRLADRKQVDLRLFIHPIHASLQQIIKYSDLWPAFEAWKRDLVRIITDQNLNKSQKVKTLGF